MKEVKQKIEMKDVFNKIEMNNESIFLKIVLTSFNPLFSVRFLLKLSFVTV